MLGMTSFFWSLSLWVKDSPDDMTSKVLLTQMTVRSLALLSLSHMLKWLNSGQLIVLACNKPFFSLHNLSECRLFILEASMFFGNNGRESLLLSTALRSWKSSLCIPDFWILDFSNFLKQFWVLRKLSFLNVLVFSNSGLALRISSLCFEHFSQLALKQQLL